MKILIIGASGLLGGQLVKDFSRKNEVLGVDKNNKIEGVAYLDLLQKERIQATFQEFKPEVVILSAAITAVDWSEQNKDLVWNVNVEAVKEVAVAAKKQGTFLTFYSTDYIFNGKEGPYSEEAKPDPINFYGKTKLEAEQIIQKELNRSLVIRTCSIYGYQKKGKNFAMQALNSLRAKESFKAFHDQFGTPTYVEGLSGITLNLINGKKEGIFNVVGPDYVNRVQFSEGIAEIFDLDKGLIKKVSSEEVRQIAERPRKGGLKVDKLKLETGVKPMSLMEGLRAMKTKAVKEIKNK